SLADKKRRAELDTPAPDGWTSTRSLWWRRFFRVENSSNRGFIYLSAQLTCSTVKLERAQSVKAAWAVGEDSRGYDPGKKINGCKRHLVVGARGLPLMVMVTPADLHDLAPAEAVLFRLRPMHPDVTLVWADRAYAGKLVTWAKKHQNLIKTVARLKGTSGFVLLPRRWVLERSLAGMMNPRRHARDYERLIQHFETLITWASITLMTRRLTRATRGVPAPVGNGHEDPTAPCPDQQGEAGQGRPWGNASGSVDQTAQAAEHHTGTPAGHSFETSSTRVTSIRNS
ncbi:transposase, partial [Streptomyces massasporeus]|uniref:transposase n=1 Tax=Streptomyces massasporeus TaxID=67324 RepID=UPI003677A757